MKIISLGWGVQSFTLAAMVALGELEPIDFAIHADTLHESALTYQFAERWTGWLFEHGVKVVTVKPESSPVIDEFGGIMIPAHAKQGNKSDGIVRRQCTDKWKRAPMRKWLQENRNGVQVEQWVGISLDEFQRMKDSDVKYIKHRWPLIEKKMRRIDCVLWLEQRGIEIPPKSACTFCPFTPTKDWPTRSRIMSDWIDAVTVDNHIRNYKPGYELYVHRSHIPLSEIDMRSEEEKGQLAFDFGFNDECSGVCGV